MARNTFLFTLVAAAAICVEVCAAAPKAAAEVIVDEEAAAAERQSRSSKHFPSSGAWEVTITPPAAPGSEDEAAAFEGAAEAAAGRELPRSTGAPLGAGSGSSAEMPGGRDWNRREITGTAGTAAASTAGMAAGASGANAGRGGANAHEIAGAGSGAKAQFSGSAPGFNAGRGGFNTGRGDFDTGLGGANAGRGGANAASAGGRGYVGSLPHAAASPEEELTSKGPYHGFQVGAYREKHNAVELQEKLSKDFPDVYMTRIISGGEPLYRVRVGKLRDAAAIAKLKSRLRRAGFAAFPVTQPR